MIYIVSHYYPPVSNPSAVRMEYLAKLLLERYGADQVRVITGRPNYPDGKLLPEDKWRLFRRQTGRWGETIYHLYEFPAPFKGLYRKTLGLLSLSVSLFIFFFYANGSIKKTSSS